MLPLMVMTPHESRDRSGSIEPALAGLTAASRDSWTLYRGLGEAATLLLSPEGSFDRSGTVTPSLLGGVLTVPGQYGPAWRFAPATKNLITNPRHDPRYAQFGRNGTGSTIAQDTTVTREGIPSLKWTNPQAVAGSIYSMVLPGAELAVGDVLTCSGWLRSALPLRFRSQIHTGSRFIETERFNFSAGPDGWTRIVVTSNPLTAEDVAGAIRFYVYIDSPQSERHEVDTMWLVQPQVEKGAGASAYADGSVGAGHAWTGTPHNSTSVRETAYITVPNTPDRIGTGRGTVLIRFRADSTAPSSRNPHLIYTAPESGQRWWFYRHGASGGMYSWVGDGSHLSTPIPLDRPAWVGVTWGEGQAGLSSSWHAPVTFAYGSDPRQSNTIHLGVNSALTWVGQIEAVAAYDEALPSGEIAAITGMDRAWEWGDDGTLTVPVSGTPGEVYVRYRRDGITLTDRLLESGPLGEAGTVEITGSAITIRASEDVEILGMLAYEAPLPLFERSRIEEMDTWRWEDIVPQLGGILRIPSAEPLMISRVQTAEPIAVSRAKPVEPIVISRIPGEM